MDAMNAMRIWGIAVSAACMAGALGVAAMEPAPRVNATQIAQAEPAAPVGFLVRFRGNGPVARAQALAARGQVAQAERRVRAQLARQSGLRGLCFERFTVGAAEIVLRSCEAVSPRQNAAVQARWLARLNAMASVEYADANVAASTERAPG
jgi:hypothetical protein